jgi:DNA ligase-4
MEEKEVHDQSDVNINKIPFAAVCELFERCVKSSKHAKKKQLIQKLFSLYKGENIFPLMRLLLPQLDKERQTYGLKETMLGKYYVEILNIAPTSEDAIRLIQWRKPNKTATGQMEGGDFGTAVFTSLKPRCIQKGDCSVGDINTYLDQLNVSTDRKDKSKILTALLRRTTAVEQKWLVRIILKELKIGLSEKSILNYFHDDAVDYFNVTSNLRKVCDDLKNPSVRVSQENVTLFHPIKPMLASRHLPEQVVKLMDDSEFAIETKYDGERIQIHKDGKTIKLFSRNSNNVTDIYGDKLIPIIMERVKVAQCIIDGELVVWDNIAGRFEEFGKLKTLANFGKLDESIIDGKHDIGENYGKQLCYIAFDLLYVNSKSVMDLTLSQRVTLLKRCIPQPKSKLFEVAEQKLARTLQEVIDALDNAIANREEGIIVKNLNTIYVPNERKQKWIKLKPEYLDGVGDDLDLIILGGYYGTGIGRRGGTISHFMMGIMKSPNMFYSVCKVGSGYSDTELKVLQKTFEKHWRVYNPQSPPTCFQLADGHKEKPDVWLDPKQSRILQIKAAQLVPTEKYKTGFTLRFPRVMKIRTDKSWDQCMTYVEFLELMRLTDGRLSRRKIGDRNDSQEDGPTTGTGKRKQIAPRRTWAVLKHFQPVDPSAVEVKGDLFANLEFCVMNGDQQQTKSALELMIHSYKGSTVQYPTINTFCVIAARETLKVQNLISREMYDVVHYKWLLECVQKESLVALEPRLMIYAKPETQAVFENDIDKFGDSYTHDTTVPLLREVFQHMDKIKLKQLEQEMVHTSTTTDDGDPRPLKKIKLDPTIKAEQKIKDELKATLAEAYKDVDILGVENKHGRPWWGLFRGYSIYLAPEDPIVASEGELLCKMAAFYGARITPNPKEASHVLVGCQQSSFTRSRLPRKAEFITVDWLRRCLNSKELQYHSMDED